MKKTLLLLLAVTFAIGIQADGKKKADMRFDKTTIDLGQITNDSPIKECYFTFTNTGNADLYIHQIITSCSCTGRKYPTHAIKPGATDTIFVTYNAENKSPRRFRTSITIHSNAVNEMTKLYLKGEIMPKEVKENEAIEIEE
ncbi:MAG: DUF1573 domain-containing protein [Bacteroidaceae bacterium]|nr:DUF1573 domain-containing protein [Bacteroidaceae bacterium]